MGWADTAASIARFPWPLEAAALVEEQRRLGALSPRPWAPPPAGYTIGGCFVCFPRGLEGRGAAGDRAWAGAVLLEPGRSPATSVIEGVAEAAYAPGLLALREGRLLDAAVRGLRARPDVLLVNATGRDHPRGAGLALQLGAALDLPTIGVTHRPLVASGEWPPPKAHATAPLELEGEVVGAWLRTSADARPLAAHAAWRTDVRVAVAVVVACSDGRRTPEPLRLARQAARRTRAAAR